METALRTALLDWLRADPALTSRLNAIADESPATASPPWLGIAASAAQDWSTKDADGREIRVALELDIRGSSALETEAIVAAVAARIAAIPTRQPGFALASATFLRSRAERRPGNWRATLLEWRFRVLAT